MTIKPRWKKVLADFWEHKARALLVIASIFIGVYAIGMMMITQVILPASMQKVYQSVNPAHIIIQTESFDQDLLDGISNMEGVAAVEGRRSVTVQARVHGIDWENLQIVAVDNPANNEINQLNLESGYFPSEKGDLILVVDSLSDYPVEPGDTMEVQLHDGVIRSMNVSGIVRDYTLGKRDPMNRWFAYTDRSSLNFLHASDSYNILYIVTDGNPVSYESIQEIAAKVKARVENSGREVLSEKLQTPDEHPFGVYISTITAILTFLGGLVVVLSSFLIINMMNSLMSQQVRQIGVMKLIGAKTLDIVGMYLVMVFLFGFFAFILGIPAASRSAYLLSALIAQELNGYLIDVPPLPITTGAIIVQTVVAFIVPTAASLMPVLQGARTNVRQALDNSLIKNEVKTTGFDRWMEHIRGVYGIFLLALRNTFRRKGRLALTLFTLSFGGAIFISVFNVQAVLNQQINLVANYSAADLYLTFDRAYLKDEVIPIAESISGITMAEGWQVLNAQLDTGQEVEKVYIEAPPDGSELLNSVTQTGRWVREDEINTIVVNEGFLRTFPDLQPGDLITLTVNEKDVDLTVTGIFNYAGTEEKRAYINERTGVSLTQTHTKTDTYRLVTENQTLEGQVEMEERVNEVFRGLGFDVSGISAVKVLVNEISEQLNLVIYVLLINAILIGMVGSIGLSGTLSLNVLERTSEIGILRAIGAHDRIISQLVLYEGLFIGMVSYVIAFALSLPLSVILGNLVNQVLFNAEASFELNFVGYIVWFILVFVMSLIASLLPARNATRLTIREVLAYE